MSLFDDFDPPSVAEWRSEAARELKGRDPKALAWTTDDGIELKPLYRPEDVAGIEPRELYSSRHWKIGCEVDGVEAARYAVEGGAEVLYIEAGDVKGPAFDPVEIIRADSPNLMRIDDYATPAAQLASLLRHAAATIVELPIGSEYVTEIAKLRAARLLWGRVSSQPIRILARTSKRNQTIYDPYVNLLRATTEAMSAIIGGCDILVVRPFDAAYEHPGEFSRRMAINTQLILREESHFEAMGDPAAGCWYLEWLTDRLIRDATDLYESGADRPAPPRERVFVGVNKYADLNERALARLSIADEDRDAWPYEKARLDAERGGAQ